MGFSRIGKNLPAHITRAVNTRMAPGHRSQTYGLLEQTAALGRLLAAEVLNTGDRIVGEAGPILRSPYGTGFNLVNEMPPVEITNRG